VGLSSLTANRSKISEGRLKKALAERSFVGRALWIRRSWPSLVASQQKGIFIFAIHSSTSPGILNLVALMHLEE